MSSETQLVFRPDILIVIFFLGARFCLVDVFRFHVPPSSVGNDFSTLTALTILCISGSSFVRMFSFLQLVFRLDIVTDYLFSGVRFCLVPRDGIRDRYPSCLV